MVGWVNYFGRSNMKAFIAVTDKWLRRRIRMVYWKQWKKASMRIRALRKLGIYYGKAYEWSQSRKGCWRVAGEQDALHLAHQRFSPSEGMGMLAGRLQETPCNINIGNRPLRNRTVGGVGGRRGDIPAPPTRSFRILFNLNLY